MFAFYQFSFMCCSMVCLFFFYCALLNCNWKITFLLPGWYLLEKFILCVVEWDEINGAFFLFSTKKWNSRSSIYNKQNVLRWIFFRKSSIKLNQFNTVWKINIRYPFGHWDAWIAISNHFHVNNRNLFHCFEANNFDA